MGKKAREEIKIVLVQRSPIKFNKFKNVSCLFAFLKQKICGLML